MYICIAVINMRLFKPIHARHRSMCIVCRALLILISVIASSHKVLAEDFPVELRDLICALDGKTFDVVADVTQYRYSQGMKQSRDETIVAEAYWLCPADERIFLAYKGKSDNRIELDEFIFQDGKIYKVRIEGQSEPTLSYKWNSKKKKLQLMMLHKDFSYRGYDNSGNAIKKEGRALRATGHIIFKGKTIEIKSMGPLRPFKKTLDVQALLTLQ